MRTLFEADVEVNACSTRTFFSCLGVIALLTTLAVLLLLGLHWTWLPTVVVLIYSLCGVGARQTALQWD